jgi:hypothetical protein
MKFCSIFVFLSVLSFQGLASVCGDVYLTQEQAIKSQLQKFVSQFPEQSSYLPSSTIEFHPPHGEKSWTGERDTLLISTAGLDPIQIKTLSTALLKILPEKFISFPLKEGATHLLTRLRQEVFDFDTTDDLNSPRDYSRNLSPVFKKSAYRPPSSSSRRIEPMVRLSEPEFIALQNYIHKALLSPKSILGDFNMQGKLDNSISSRNGHNCTSWLCSFEINPSESMSDILGVSSKSPVPLNVGTNPGYFAAHLATLAPRERVPFLVIWTPEALNVATQRLKTKKMTDWNFNPLD